MRGVFMKTVYNLNCKEYCIVGDSIEKSVVSAIWIDLESDCSMFDNGGYIHAIDLLELSRNGKVNPKVANRIVAYIKTNNSPLGVI